MTESIKKLIADIAHHVKNNTTYLSTVTEEDEEYCLTLLNEWTAAIDTAKLFTYDEIHLKYGEFFDYYEDLIDYGSPESYRSFLDFEKDCAKLLAKIEVYKELLK